MIAGSLEIRGKRFVIVPEEEYDKLVMRESAEDALPPLPKPQADGNYDAVAYARASLARKLIRDRIAAGLSQAELARRAKISPETLNRIEKLKMSPTVSIVDRLDRALRGKAKPRVR